MHSINIFTRQKKANNNHAHTYANAIAKSYVYPRTYN